MVITKEQGDEMLTAARPLMAWLEKTCHPHCCVVVDPDRVELLEGLSMRTLPTLGGVSRSWGPSDRKGFMPCDAGSSCRKGVCAVPCPTCGAPEGFKCGGGSNMQHQARRDLAFSKPAPVAKDYPAEDYDVRHIACPACAAGVGQDCIVPGRSAQCRQRIDAFKLLVEGKPAPAPQSAAICGGCGDSAPALEAIAHKPTCPVWRTASQNGRIEVLPAPGFIVEADYHVGGCWTGSGPFGPVSREVAEQIVVNLSKNPGCTAAFIRDRNEQA